MKIFIQSNEMETFQKNNIQHLFKKEEKWKFETNKN